MTKLTLSVPIVGEKRTTAEPKVDTALSAIETWANGNVGANNIEAKGVTEAMLSTALQTLINEKTAGGTTKKKEVETSQERESAVFGVLATPDEVEVTLASGGLIAVWYQATWQSSVASAGRAAIFLGANQLKLSRGNKEPQVQEATGASTTLTSLATGPIGLVCGGSSENYTGGDVTTGQIVGTEATAGAGVVYIFAAAGTYKISVKFRATSGHVTVSHRKLWALALA